MASAHLLQLSPNDRDRILTATAGQTDFPTDFPVMLATDLRVQTRPGSSGAWTDATFGADFTVLNAGATGGATARFTVGRAAGSQVRLLGLASISRTASVVTGGRFRSEVIDQQLDRLSIHAQEARRDLDALDISANDIAAAVAAAAASAAEAEAWATAAETTVLPDGSIVDAKISAAAVLRNRQLDMVFLTDPMTVSERAAYRNNENPDITQRWQDAENMLHDAGELYIPRRNARLTGPLTKRRSTWWRGVGSTVLGTVTCQYNGDLITINGSGQSRDGGMERLRFIGNKTTYPLSRNIVCNEVFTHEFNAIRSGGFSYSLWGLDCKALIMNNYYCFDISAHGILLDGTTVTANTDHRFKDCQFTGDLYGFYARNGSTFKFEFCRPQASGLANMAWENIFDSQMIGGYCDSGIIHPLNAAGSPVSGNGDGLRLINVQRGLIKGVNFYSNGNVADPSRAMVRIAANDGSSTAIDLVENKMLESPLAPMVGIVIQTPSGGGFHRRLFLNDNDLTGVTVPVQGLANMGAGGTFFNNEGVADYAALGDNLNTAATISPEILTYRITGQNFNRNVVLSGVLNRVGKRVDVWFESGSGTVTIMQPDGSTSIATMTAGQRRTFVCRQASNTPAAALFA